MECILVKIKRKKSSWAGHIMCTTNTRWSIKINEMGAEGSKTDKGGGWDGITRMTNLWAQSRLKAHTAELTLSPHSSFRILNPNSQVGA